MSKAKEAVDVRNYLYVVNQKNCKGVNVDEVEAKCKKIKIDYKRTDYGIFYTLADFDKMAKIVKESTHENKEDDS